jgi:phosphatidylinositol 4-kinase
VVDRLNHALADILQKEDADADSNQFIQTFLSRYVSRGRPLSGYFIVCCIIETQWTVLAQALAPPQATNYGNAAEAAAANKAWLSLMRRAALDLDITDEKTRSTLKMTIGYAMQCFADLLVQIEEMDSEPSIDTYAWETMSESLVGPHPSLTCILLRLHTETRFYLFRGFTRVG